MKITVDVDPDLYRALKVEAARADRSIRDVLSDAVAAWLAQLEDEEDRASAAEALAEYEREGGVAAAEFFERLAAETRAAYGSPGVDPDPPGHSPAADPARALDRPGPNGT